MSWKRQRLQHVVEARQAGRQLVGAAAPAARSAGPPRRCRPPRTAGSARRRRAGHGAAGRAGRPPDRSGRRRRTRCAAPRTAGTGSSPSTCSRYRPNASSAAQREEDQQVEQTGVGQQHGDSGGRQGARYGRGKPGGLSRLPAGATADSACRNRLRQRRQVAAEQPEPLLQQLVCCAAPSPRLRQQAGQLAGRSRRCARRPGCARGSRAPCPTAGCAGARRPRHSSSPASSGCGPSASPRRWPAGAPDRCPEQPVETRPGARRNSRLSALRSSSSASRATAQALQLARHGSGQQPPAAAAAPWPAAARPARLARHPAGARQLLRRRSSRARPGAHVPAPSSSSRQQSAGATARAAARHSAAQLPARGSQLRQQAQHARDAAGGFVADAPAVYGSAASVRPARAAAAAACTRSTASAGLAARAARAPREQAASARGVLAQLAGRARRGQVGDQRLLALLGGAPQQAQGMRPAPGGQLQQAALGRRLYAAARLRRDQGLTSRPEAPSRPSSRRTPS